MPDTPTLIRYLASACSVLVASLDCNIISQKIQLQLLPQSGSQISGSSSSPPKMGPKKRPTEKQRARKLKPRAFAVGLGRLGCRKPTEKLSERKPAYDTCINHKSHTM